MQKMKKLAAVWGAGVLGVFMLYITTGGEINGVNMGLVRLVQ